MELITWLKCGKEIYSSITVCPSCGYITDLEQETRSKREI